MKLELKSIKYTEWMSEETLCFTANLWVDGKVFAEVSNQGHGGCTDVHMHSKSVFGKSGKRTSFYRQLKEVQAHCKSMPSLEPCALFGAEGLKTFSEGLPMSLELWCNMEVEEFLARRDLNRKLKSHVLFLMEGKDGIYQTKFHPTVTDGSWKDGRRILNDMSEVDALAIWKAN